jgi:capsular exopolysaccharide synthesis family protein
MELTRDDSQPTAHVLDYLVILWYRKWLILLVFAVLSSVGLFAVFKLVKPKYQSTSRIAVERLRGPVADQTGLAGEAFYQTQYQIMGSSEVAAAAAVKLGWSPSREVALEDGRAEIINKAVAISPERDNRVVRIQSRQSDPKLAAQLVNAVVEAYTEVTHQRETERAGRFQNDLQGQIVQLEMQIEAKKRALDEFGKDKNLQQQQQEEALVRTRLSAISEAQVRAKVSREQAERSYNDLKAKSDTGVNLVENVSSSYAEQLNIRVKELQQQRKLLELNKTPKALSTDPQYIQTMALIDQYQADYEEAMKKAQTDANRVALAQANSGFDQARQVEETLNQQMTEMRLKLESLATGLTALARYNELKKDIDDLAKWHGNLRERLMEAKISDSFPLLDIQVLDRAKPPAAPAWPNKTQLAIVAIAMSFVVGVAVAFLAEYMDRSVRKPEDIEQDLRLALVGFVPGMNNSTAPFDRARIVMSDPTTGAAESYRKIRAKLHVSRNEAHIKVLGITSSTAGEGKTTLSSNLAISMAQSGFKVLLVDADMRHPALQTAFQVEREPGLADYLDGRIAWQSAVRGEVLPGLSLITCGSGGERSSELLESPRLKEFFDQAREQYDMVVVDTPPVLGVADTTVLAHATDAMLFVIQASRNPKWLLRRARMELDAADAHIVGAVLNRVATRRGEYYYYHKYYPKKA